MGGRPVHCRMFGSSTPRLARYPLGGRITPVANFWVTGAENTLASSAREDVLDR